MNIQIMEELLRIKFYKPDFKNALKNTGDKKLIEGNYWHDKFWGMEFCPDRKLRGKNW